MAKNKKKLNFQISTSNRYVINNLYLANYRQTYKTDIQTSYYNDAVKFFSDKDYFKSIEKFFYFLKNKNSENVKFKTEESKLGFELIQGSNIIKCKCSANKFVAISNIYSFDVLSKELARELLMINYNLQYCKFAIEKNTILLKFEIPIYFAHPDYLYYALKEMALNADKYDDLLCANFKYLNKINNLHIINYSKEILEKKLKYFKIWLKKSIVDFDKQDVNKMSGARTYIAMSTIFKIAFLLSPHGYLEEQLRKIILKYLNLSNNFLEFNVEVGNFLKNLSLMPDKNITENFYITTYTFNPLESINNNQILDFIRAEVNKIYTYEAMNKKLSNNKNIFELNYVYDYIVGFIQYKWTIDEVWEELFQLYWEIRYSEYFEDFGVKYLPIENNKIKIFDVNFRIKNLNMIAKKKYKNFFFNPKHLNTSNIQDFFKSFFQNIIILNFS